MADAADNYSGSAGGGNEWEVVSLTASSYAAAPGHVLPLPLPLDAHKKTEFSPPAAAPSAIFMSHHFNMPAAAEAHTNILNGCQQEESTPAMVDDEGVADDLDIPDREKEVQDVHKTLGLEDATSFEDAGNGLLQKGTTSVCFYSPGEEERQATVVGFQSHTTQQQPDAAGSDNPYVHHVSAADAATDGTTIIADPPNLPCLTAPHAVPAAPPSSSNIPRAAAAEAWWSRTFSFLRNNAKESLTFRIVLVAATVVGLAVLGQRDRLQLRLQFDVDGEKISCAVREPLGQVKLSMLIAQG